MDYNKRILQFFTNELSSEERRELKLEMTNNPELSEDMKLQQEVLYTIANDKDEEHDFKKQLQEIGNEFLEEKKEKPSSFRINYWLAAASVIVVIGLGSYLSLLKSSNYTGSQAFVEYYAPYGADMTVRGGEQSTLFDVALKDYQSGDMTAAIESFAELRDENEELAGFFTALCFMEMGDIKEAQQQLRSTQEVAIFYEEQIKWYMALCHLKLDEYAQAELLLTQLQTTSNKYSNQAEELLSKVNF
jgi:tetratricopeptide (TPR) repeat protein